MAADQVAAGDLIDVQGAGGGQHHDKGQHESIITRIRSRTGSTSVNSLGIHRTSTRESQQSGGSHGESSISGGHGLASLISNTRTFFKRHNRSGSVDTPSPTTTTTPTTPSEEALQAAGLAGVPSIETAPPISSSTSNSGNESRREGISSSTSLPPPIAPDRAFTPPPLRHTGAGSAGSTAHSSSDNNTTTSSSSSIPQHHGGYSSSVATTVNSDLGSPNEEHHHQQQQQIQATKPSLVSPGTTSRDFALPPGAAALPAPSSPSTVATSMPLSTEARYRALPRLQSYSVTHPTASTSTSANSEDHDAAEYDTTTSMSGTETEHDDEEEESEAEEGEEEGEDDDDEHEHDEEDVRGGVNAMRTSLRRPALPTLSSTRGFSRSANTPGVSPTTTTTSSNSNPFNFQGWTTFASSTPTPGPLRTARPQSGDNTLNGSYFDPRPTSSSSRASTVFQTPAQTPRGENGPSPAIYSTSAGKARQQQQQQSPLNNAGLIPTPGASISPPSSRIRMEGPSRPSSGSPLAATAAGRRPSAGTFVRTANGQSIPLSSIPNISGVSTTPSSSSSSSRINLASTSGNRPSFYSRQSKSLVDLSRSLSLDTDETSAAASATTVAGPSAVSNKAPITALSGSDDRTGGTTSTTNTTSSNNSITSSSTGAAVVHFSSSPSSASVVPANENIPQAIPSSSSSTAAATAEEDHTLELEAVASQAELGNSLQSQVPPVGSPPPSFATASTTASGVMNHNQSNGNAATASRSRNQSPNRQLLQRRQSMPEMRIDPPLYQIDDDFNVQYREGQLPTAREDEGNEALPNYTCDVHIEGYVPRKMEFVKPGIQAKDRRWKRQYVILHGTSVKIYKSDPRLKAVPGEEPPPTPGIHTDKYRPTFNNGSGASSKTSLVTGNKHAGSQHHIQFPHHSNNQQQHNHHQQQRARAPTESSISSASSMESEKALLWNRAVQDAIAKKKYDPDMPVHVHLQEEDEHGLASLQHAPSTLLAKASENRCIRHYTLQGAESGLAADYLKRRHVVRVRAEGEQFLIQCKDDRAVIDWIEALQAATNTALDLDVRPLPKFITLPRRRRRRRPADPNNPTAAAGGGVAGAGTTTATGAAAATAGGTATNAAPGTAAAARQDSQEVSASSDAMNAMLAEDQDAYLGSTRSALV